MYKYFLIFSYLIVGESWESENKSWFRQNDCRKSICQCHDPFYPKDEPFNKDDLGDIDGEELYYGNESTNTKLRRSLFKNDPNHYPESKNSFSRSWFKFSFKFTFYLCF